MFNNYPYTDYHELNTDWIISKIKNVETAEANSKQYAEDAESAKDIAVQAKDDAVAAKDAAEHAQGLAESAQAAAHQSEINAGDIVANTNNQIAVLQARVDNIIPDGTQTVGNTELIDIRVAADGTIYASAGDAVRAQAAYLDNIVNQVTMLSPNLHDDSTDHIGYYFYNGSYVASESYNATDKVPVLTGETYYFSNSGAPVMARFVGFFTPALNYLTGSDLTNAYSVTIPVNAAYMVVTFSNAYTEAQIEKDQITSYMPYGYYYVKNDRVQDLDIVENQLLRTEHETIGAGTYPVSLRTGYKVTYVGNIVGTFSSFNLDRGTGSEKERVFVGSSIIKYILNNETLSVAHNLTWQDKCIVIIESIDLAHTKITLVTNGGMFEHTFDRPKGTGNYGSWSSPDDTMGGTITQHITKTNDIWLLGDSYMSYADKRISGALYEMGQKTPTILSIPGATTSTMVQEFINMVDYYKVIPATLCVCTGMNDDSFGQYRDAITPLIEYVKKYNIKLILTAIPITPARTTKNLHVRNNILTLGYPVIRFDEAVGSSDAGVWYAGCLDTDNIHPTQAGARLLASAIIDSVGYVVD